MSKKQIQIKAKAVAVTIPDDTNALKKLKISLGMIIGAFAFILYAQSISFDYTYDDHTVTKENRIVKEGFAGIPTILKTDYWFGYNREELRGAIYRPMPLILFAVEWQLFPNNPHAFHFINVLLNSLLCLLIFFLLSKLFDKQSLLFPFACGILYTAHPIHTEVVDNIKSCDEILCFLFSIISVLFILKYISTNKILPLIIGAGSYFIALLSKETATTFLVITPLILYLFRKTNRRGIITITTLLAVVTACYLFIRYEI